MKQQDIVHQKLAEIIADYKRVALNPGHGSESSFFHDGRHAGAVELAKALGIPVRDWEYGRKALNQIQESPAIGGAESKAY